MKSGKTLIGVLAGLTVGAAVGAALGIIYAPDKGSVTRKKILKNGNEYTNALVTKFTELIEIFTMKFELINKELPKLIPDAKQNGEGTVEKVPPLVHK